MNLMDIISNTPCSCGKVHSFDCKVISGTNAVKKLPDAAAAFNAKKAFVVSDANTHRAAGDTVCKLLDDAGISYTSYCFKKETPEPDEANVGLAFMYYPADCDIIIGIGSGVINDICKIVANVAHKPYIIVATAPSMDGYASATSSMTRDGIKISLPSKCPDVIIGDTDILCTAPVKMMKSGLGDMLAKYVSIAEWRIAHIINGEYYCERVAQLVRDSLQKCIDNAPGLLHCDKDAVLAVFDGLVTCGAAMNLTGVSRPASGVEHYISHIWDMRGIEFDIPVEFHGIQCAVGTLMTAKLYEKLATISPDKQKALKHASEFDFDNWSNMLRGFLGKAAESMIALEAKEQKYNPQKLAPRLDVIFDNWSAILNVVKEEIPPVADLKKLYRSIGLPETPEQIGIDKSIVPMTFKASKDIRNKYVLSHLAWDLGILDELCNELK
ncbi:MAG: sn-glycerol-1-phosphate dehydrogenase [Clostridia bacterium]|nr:sn-glycerol-1-phosphate dehydrogenase [Clostridia bacterium]